MMSNSISVFDLMHDIDYLNELVSNEGFTKNIFIDSIQVLDETKQVIFCSPDIKSCIAFIHGVTYHRDLSE